MQKDLGCPELGENGASLKTRLYLNVEWRVDPIKIEAMVPWSKPKTLKALRGLLGLREYFLKFIQNYGKIVTPLTNMLKKDSFE